MNLPQNALQAMESKGTLSMSVEDIGPWVRVSMAHTGSGIPDHPRDRIFETFFTKIGRASCRERV